MKKINLKRPSAGFYMLAVALLFTVVGFILFFASYNIFGYTYSRTVIALTVLAIWSIAVILFSTLYSGEKPLWIAAFYLLTVFALAVSAVEFINPGIGNIATYFTVNMGDMETAAKAIPVMLSGVALYLLATIIALVACFLPAASKKNKEANA